MRVSDIIKHLENWAPIGIAWEKDNVGLQIGNPASKVENVLLCLEVNSGVVDDAIKKRCNLIISHHPLIFSPLKALISKEPKTEIIQKLLKNDINLYSAHTNLDFTKDGVSFQLAKQLKLINIKFLKNLSANQYKLVVFVPEKHIETVAQAMHKAGAGIIGEYSDCSFRLKGIGTFKGSDFSNPFLGIKQNLEFVEEIRLEMVVNSFNLAEVLKAMRENHPYEEVAYDVYKLDNDNPNYGIGAIGELKEEMNEKDFLNFISKSIKTKNFRYCSGKKNKIKKVAVCGGSGSDLLDFAIKQNADAFLTADVKYHTFHDAQNKILLIDAGHYQTEIFILKEIERRLNDLFREKEIKVFNFSGSTNPIKFYKNSGD
jgi:dinuclear metal center YbgI/SA1388 family protein